MSDNFYAFNPLSSINSYELAQILQTLMMISIDDVVMDRLPKECKKHFQKVSEDQLHEMIRATKEPK